jgi:hypothetical protein
MSPLPTVTPPRTPHAPARGSRAMARLRQRFFASAADVASRHGVSFERLLLHLWQARAIGPRIPLHAVHHVDDLALAAACIDGQQRAWAELVEQHEGHLLRVCRRQLDESDAIVFARRAIADIRHASTALPPATELALLSLRSYRGTRPLRGWLIDRTVGRLVAEHAGTSWRLRSQAPPGATERDARALGLTPARQSHMLEVIHREAPLEPLPRRAKD